jgi:hypothetical protein
LIVIAGSPVCTFADEKFGANELMIVVAIVDADTLVQSPFTSFEFTTQTLSLPCNPPAR